MSHGFRSMIILLSGAIVLSSASAVSARTPVARVAGGCGVGNGEGFGYTYLTSLTVHNTSCSTGRHLAHKHGHLSGWHCNTRRLISSPTQYQDKETCTQGSRTVVWTFTQNT